MEKQVYLRKFTNKNFDKGANLLKRTLWYFINALLVRVSWNPFMNIKIILLKSFGAQIGKDLVIKNNVCIKSPWKLNIGDNVWLGENVWIDNLDYVTIGNNVCISQGALLLTGNHDYKSESFDYKNAPIIIEDGTWIGAKSVVCPGVTVKSHAILTVGSIATKDMDAYKVYQGNPAVAIRNRIIK
jgi:acetyltransferase